MKSGSFYRQGPGRTRGPRNWIVTKKVTFKARGVRNPWIFKIAERRRNEFTNLLKEGCNVRAPKYIRKVRQKYEFG